MNFTPSAKPLGFRNNKILPQLKKKKITEVIHCSSKLLYEMNLSLDISLTGHFLGPNSLIQGEILSSH